MAAPGWTAARETAFFEALGLSCNVAHSARQAGVAVSSAYRRRRTVASFRERWFAAVHEGYVRLELALLERALIGCGDLPGDIDEKDRLDPSLQALPPAVLLAMLKMHREVAKEGTPGVPADDEQRAEELRARIAGKLKRLKARIEGGA